jgi:hypothetical protein
MQDGIQAAYPDEGLWRRRDRARLLGLKNRLYRGLDSRRGLVREDKL